jgi:hypothetical protein
VRATGQRPAENPKPNTPATSGPGPQARAGAAVGDTRFSSACRSTTAARNSGATRRRSVLDELTESAWTVEV